MRPRRSRRGGGWCGVRGGRLIAALIALGTAVMPLGAQNGIAREGAIFLLLPMGAAPATAGQSVADPEASTAQLYWNPAGAARQRQREAAFHHGSYFVGPYNAGALLLPFDRAGVLGLSVGVLDYGQQETGDASGQTGTLAQQAYVLQATYATPLGPRASFGVSYKLAKFVGSCSGLCPPVAVFDVSSSAVDIGLQYAIDKAGDVVIGTAVRHAGLRLQVNDEAQADPLPSRVQLGLSYRVRRLERELPGTVVRVSLDAIDRLLTPGDMALRGGTSVLWRDRLALRVGYVTGSGEGTGASVGFGVRAGRARVDVGRILGGGVDAGNGSNFVSLSTTW
jgi:hypothetical protein